MHSEKEKKKGTRLSVKTDGKQRARRKEEKCFKAYQSVIMVVISF